MDIIAIYPIVNKYTERHKTQYTEILGVLSTQQTLVISCSCLKYRGYFLDNMVCGIGALSSFLGISSDVPRRPRAGESKHYRSVGQH
jgi:hypothetical protein